MGLFYSFTSTLLRTYFSLFYQLRVYGIENLPKGEAIIAPNHASFYDPPVIAASAKEEFSFLARRTLFDQFFLGSLIRALNSYPVSGTTQDLSSIKLICSLLKEGKKVVIFPEGVRCDDGNLSTIKPGVSMMAFRAEAPIVPVYIDGTFEVWNKNRRFPKWTGKITLVFGKPIYPKDFIDSNKKEAQEKMTRALEKSLYELKDSDIVRR